MAGTSADGEGRLQQALLRRAAEAIAAAERLRDASVVADGLRGRWRLRRWSPDVPGAADTGSMERGRWPSAVAAGWWLTFKNERVIGSARSAPSSYRIKIEDKATIHNFHLTGPGVNKKTSISGRTETVWTVRLRPGKYTFVCDPHASMMRGTFRVT